MVAECSYERLQIQVAESHRSQVRISLGAIKISYCKDIELLFELGLMLVQEDVMFKWACRFLLSVKFTPSLLTLLTGDYHKSFIKVHISNNVGVIQGQKYHKMI